MSLRSIIVAVGRVLEVNGKASDMTENQFMTAVIMEASGQVNLPKVKAIYYDLIRDEGFAAVQSPMAAITDNINHFDYYMP